MKEKLTALLPDVSEETRDRIAAEMDAAVEKRVRKELKRRSRRAAARVLLAGALAVCGWLAYAYRDEIRAFAAEKSKALAALCEKE